MLEKAIILPKNGLIRSICERGCDHTSTQSVIDAADVGDALEFGAGVWMGEPLQQKAAGPSWRRTESHDHRWQRWPDRLEHLPHDQRGFRRMRDPGTLPHRCPSSANSPPEGGVRSHSGSSLSLVQLPSRIARSMPSTTPSPLKSAGHPRQMPQLPSTMAIDGAISIGSAGFGTPRGSP